MTQYTPGSDTAAAPLPDPEDRLFDSSSSSAAPSDTESDDVEYDPRSTQTRLLSNLQHNLDELRTNVGELTQRYPHTRNTSQISNLTSQINSFTQRLTRIRQNNLSHVQDFAREQTMDGMPRHDVPPGPPGFDQNADNDINASLSNGDLERRIDRLRQEELTHRATSTIRRHPEGGHRFHMTILDRMVAQRQRAEQELQRREGAASVFGTREEVDRQGDDYQSPLRSLFARTAETQRDFNTLMTRQREISSDLERNMQPGTPRQHRVSSEFTTSGFNQSRIDVSHAAALPLQRNIYEHPPSGSFAANIISTLTIGWTNHGSTGMNMARPPSNGASDPTFSSPPNYFAVPSSDEDRPETRLWQRRRSELLLSPQTMQGHPPRHFYPPSIGMDGQSPHDASMRSSSIRRRFDAYRGVMEHGQDTPTTAGAIESGSSGESPMPRMSVHDQRMQNLMAEQQAARMHHRMAEMRAMMLREQRDPQGQQHQPSLDNDASRPDPVEEEAKMVKLECKICFAQVSNQVILPCGQSTFGSVSVPLFQG
ncbi:MAG: hypothetical protein Q9220_000313 [cf. Caloplaca sp. 1 TL-2023]